MQTERRSYSPHSGRPRGPRAILTIIALAALLGWGLAPLLTGAQESSSPIAGSPEAASPAPASPIAYPSPEMFRNDAERNGESSGPGPSDAGQVEEIWSFDAGGDVQSSPVVVEGTVYFGSGDGSVYAVDVQTGDVDWRFRTEGEVFSSPAVVDGVVYIGSEDGKLYALDAADGTERWRFETGDMIVASPAVVGDLVYIASYDNHLYALNLADGTKRWTYEGSASFYASPTVADGLVFIGAVDGSFYALDAESGGLRWSATGATAIFSTAAVANGIVYYGTIDGALLAEDANQRRRDLGAASGWVCEFLAGGGRGQGVCRQLGGAACVRCSYWGAGLELSHRPGVLCIADRGGRYRLRRSQ